MSQITRLLAVATIFSGLWTLIFIFYSQGGGLIRKTKLPIQELELKYAGGAYLWDSMVYARVHTRVFMFVQTLN